MNCQNYQEQSQYQTTIFEQFKEDINMLKAELQSQKKREGEKGIEIQQLREKIQESIKEITIKDQQNHRLSMDFNDIKTQLNLSKLQLSKAKSETQTSIEEYEKQIEENSKIQKKLNFYIFERKRFKPLLYSYKKVYDTVELIMQTFDISKVGYLQLMGKCKNELESLKELVINRQKIFDKKSKESESSRYINQLISLIPRFFELLNMMYNKVQTGKALESGIHFEEEIL